MSGILIDYAASVRGDIPACIEATDAVIEHVANRILSLACERNVALLGALQPAGRA